MRAVAGSFFISADCAHAAHPNYMEKMDPVNHPVLGGGPVIKVNANCKYIYSTSSNDTVSRTECMAHRPMPMSTPRMSSCPVRIFPSVEPRFGAQTVVAYPTFMTEIEL